MPIIYVSSTYEDLKDYRQAVIRALQKSGYTVIGMEDYVAADERPVELCLNDVAKSDIYVGLFGFRYGYVPPKDHGNPQLLSITELEFQHAKVHNRPQLAFLAKEDAGIDLNYVDHFTGKGKNGQHITRLRDFLKVEKLATFFSSPNELALNVQSAVTKCLELRTSSTVLPTPVDPLLTPINWDIQTQGSPYPGLRHFTRDHASVFFGREREVAQVLDRMRKPEGKFLLISGASGSGKSSLVNAGVIPKISAGYLSSNKSFTSARVVPHLGINPFDALLRPLHTIADKAGLLELDLAHVLLKEPHRLSTCLEEMVDKGLSGEGLIVFLDQMEELFTLCDPDQASDFCSALYQTVIKTDVRVIATIRSDFLPSCYEHEALLMVINGGGHFALGLTDTISINDMIRKPAQCAGLIISDELVGRLATDAGLESGNLPLVAFALEQLFDGRQDNRLTEETYEELGGLEGAIGKHTDKVEKSITTMINADIQEVLPRIFPLLVNISGEGYPTRYQVPKNKFEADLIPVVDRLINERLLQAEEGEAGESMISIAHEKLFLSWPILAQWVGVNQNDLVTLRQAEMQAKEWKRRGFHYKYLWHADRLKALQGIILGLGRDVAKVVKEYAAPQARLAKILKKPLLSHRERLTIGQNLAELGDPRKGILLRKNGLPDIMWVKIPSGRITLEGVIGFFEVRSFYLSKYPVTNCQFQAFIDSGGYEDKAWWEGLRRVRVEPPFWSEANCPRENVSWFEAMAFCRWLSYHSGLAIRLPNECEWQQASGGGTAKNEHPWGKSWDPARCNSESSQLRRPTSVGMYPKGASDDGVMDLGGNVAEWCINPYYHYASDYRKSMDLDDKERSRAIRGGSWEDNDWLVRSTNRTQERPNKRNHSIGFRCAHAELL